MAARNLQRRLKSRQIKIRDFILEMSNMEGIIRTSPDILYNLLQERRKLWEQVHWWQCKQMWHKSLLRWRQEIIDCHLSTTLKEIEATLNRHEINYLVHVHYIHNEQLPCITATELAIMAACHPLLEGWRARLPTQRPLLQLQVCTSQSNINEQSACTHATQKQAELDDTKVGEEDLNGT